MKTNLILEELDAEIARLRQARGILAGAEIKAKPGRPAGIAIAPKKKIRNLSPEGRARIAAAVKARWAKQKRGS